MIFKTVFSSKTSKEILDCRQVQ